MANVSGSYSSLGLGIFFHTTIKGGRALPSLAYGKLINGQWLRWQKHQDNKALPFLSRTLKGGQWLQLLSIEEKGTPRMLRGTASYPLQTSKLGGGTFSHVSAPSPM